MYILNLFYRQACAKFSRASIVFTQWSKNGFFFTDKREIWHGTRAKFHFYRGRNVGIQPPKLSKFRILAINMCPRGDGATPFAVFLRNSQRLYASIGSFYVFNLVAFGDKQPSYKHFPSAGAFSPQMFNSPQRRNYTDPIKQS